MNKFQIMARREDWSEGVSLHLKEKTQGMGQLVAQPLVMKQVEQGLHIEPFLRLSINEAQQLIDELWQCGLRPSEGTGSAGSLKATENHLQDMRSIVMKKLNIGNG